MDATTRASAVPFALAAANLSLRSAALRRRTARPALIAPPVREDVRAYAPDLRRSQIITKVQRTQQPLFECPCSVAGHRRRRVPLERVVERTRNDACSPSGGRQGLDEDLRRRGSVQSTRTQRKHGAACRSSVAAHLPVATSPLDRASSRPTRTRRRARPAIWQHN